MHGRSSCLLAVSLLCLASPVSLRSQSGRVVDFRPQAQDPARDLPHSQSLLHVPTVADSEPVSLGRRPRPFPIGPVQLSPGASGLSQIARAAGTIFSGTVASIVPTDYKTPVPTVAITFHVEHAIRGTSAAQDLTIVQWVGLWASGQHYRVGERLLLLLYPLSKLGLTSCVAGPMGRFTVDALGRIVLSDEHAAILGTDPILGGKARPSVADFAQAIRHAEDTE